MDAPLLTADDGDDAPPELTTARRAREEQRRLAEAALSERIPQKAAAAILSRFEQDLQEALASGRTAVTVRVDPSPSCDRRAVSDIVYERLRENGYRMRASSEGGHLVVTWDERDIFGCCAVS